MTRKICVVTATRAEYGAMKCLLDEISLDPALSLQLIVTGTHLSPEFGFTVNQIKADGFEINKKIEMILSSDSHVGVSKSMGLVQISIAEAYDELKPDIVIVIGDRYELIPIVSAANVARIPVAHISGGELTEGAVDEIFRHAVTKLSQLHFTSIEDYSARVIQMGEHPDRVFCVGEPGLDNISKMILMSKTELEESLGIKFKSRNLLVTYHPVTCETVDEIIEGFNNLLTELLRLDDALIIFTKSNADVGGRVINKMIDDVVSFAPEKVVAFTSLGQLRYLSALQFVDAVVGNSSSGIVEVPSFKIPTLNIGDRQKGRIRSLSVLDTRPISEEIASAIEKIFSKEFKEILSSVTNPYAQNNTSKKIKDILKKVDLSGLHVKRFFDKK